MPKKPTKTRTPSDKARLDWLIREGCQLFKDGDEWVAVPVFKWISKTAGTHAQRAKTPRKAIDAAMKAHPKKKSG